MKKKIKWKLVGVVLSSTGLASVCMFLLCLVMVYASRYYLFAVFFNQHLLLFILAFLVLFIVFSIMFFMLLIKKHIIYLENISDSLNRMDYENLDINIPIKAEDEIGQIAQTINCMSNRLKKSFEDKRRLEQVKSDLITNISHDLRTPLTSIIGYLGLIKEKNIEDKSINQYVENAFNKSHDLKTLIDELFEYTKLQNYGFIINKKRVNLGELIEQTVMGFLPMFDQVEMKYKLDLPDEKLMVNVDPILMSRVFSNLISNALAYGKEGKSINIIIRKENQNAVIRFVNYGNPIPSEDLPNIFDRYRKGNTSGSSGLGLAIVKRIIDIHDNSIDVKSDSNKTEFTIITKLSV